MKRLVGMAGIVGVMALGGCQQAGPAIAPSSPTPTPAGTAVALPVCPAGPAVFSGAQPILTGLPSPDDLAFDAQGRLLFSDIRAGTVSRLEPDGTVRRLATGLHNPEGIVVRADGTLLVAEQLRNRVDIIDPQTGAVSIWRAFPNHTGREGIDGLGQDRRTHEVVVPDSPNGVVWRLRADGSAATQVGRAMVRPAGADVDFRGNIFVADEGGAIWKLTSSPAAQVRIASLRIPDDVLVDRDGALLVNTIGDGMVHQIDSGGSVSTLLKGLRNPQGIALDGAGNLYVTEYDAGRIDRLVRAFVVGAPVVGRLDAATVTVCPSVRRAPGYATPLAVSLADTHHGLESVVASRPAEGQTSGAIAVHVDPADRSGTIELRISDGDRTLVQPVTIPSA